MKKRKPKSDRKKLIKQLDELTKQVVRLRDEWVCQKCEKYIVHDTSTGKMFAHTAHIVSRSRHFLRWDILNLVLLDMNCHRWGHRHPLEFAEWFKKRFPARWLYLDTPVQTPDGYFKPRRFVAKSFFTDDDLRKKVKYLQQKLADLQNE